ncbi:unnamed protein product [Camellia sinensis]
MLTLSVELGKPVADPMYQQTPRPSFSEAMESCPKADIPNLKDLLKEENVYLITEAGEQGRLPVLILSINESSHQRKPFVVFLHSTHKCKEWLRPLLEAYASRGYMAVAIDSRYHGERASSVTAYQDVLRYDSYGFSRFTSENEFITQALVSSWKQGDRQCHSYLIRVRDLIKLADYLTQREYIDPSKIGITGESLGGMHAWFAAAVDTRYAVAVPIIGVQGFRWAMDHDKRHGRVDNIKAVFEETRIDLRKSAIDKEVVEQGYTILAAEGIFILQYAACMLSFLLFGSQIAYNMISFSNQVWIRIVPGLASMFDSPYSIPIIAPGEKDPRCPIEGLVITKSRACKAYEDAHCPDNFKVIAQPGIGHEMTPLMVKEASDWFDTFLK